MTVDLSSVGAAAWISTPQFMPHDPATKAQLRPVSGSASGGVALSDAQQRQIEQLKRIDARVREHEQAHIRVAGNLAIGIAAYSYSYGPDGKAYATGGEVRIDTAAEKNPEANIEKGQRVQAAALAPADPSPQDYRVAAIGSQLEAEGRTEKARNAAESSPVERKLASAYTPYQSSPEGGILDTFE